jgi:hypothetical protein
MSLRNLFQEVVESNKGVKSPVETKPKPKIPKQREQLSLGEGEQPKLTEQSILEKRKKRIEGFNQEDDSGEEGFNSLTNAFKSRMNGGESPNSKKKKEKPKKIISDSGVKLKVPSNHEEEEERGKEDEEADEPEGSEEDQGQKAPDKKKKEVVREEDSEDAGEINSEETDGLLGIDPEQLVSSSGQPIGKKAAQHIKRLKEHLSYYAEKAKAHEEKLGKINPQLEKEHKELREAHQALRQKFQDLYFEESEEFQETFVQPLKKAETEMVKWLKSHDIGDEADAGEILNPLIAKIQKSLAEGDEVKYYEAVDAAAEHLKPGASARFLAAAPALIEAFTKKEQAVKDKEKAREEVKKSSLTFAQQQSQISEKAIDDLLSGFESSNKKIIQAYKEDDRYKEYIDYDNTVIAKIKAAKTSIATAVQQRKVTEDLVKLAFNGALAELRDKEAQGFLARIEELEKANDILNRRIEEKDKSISRFKPSSKASRSVTESEDDDEEEATSMVQVFKKRMAGLS